MLRELLVASIAALLALAVILRLTGTALFQSEAARAALTRIAAHEAARALGRDVVVGPLALGDGSTLVVHGLAVAGEGGLSARPAASVQEARITYDLFGQIMAGGNPAGMFKAVELHRPSVRLTRSADGSLDLLRLAPNASKGRGRASSLATLHPAVFLHRADLRFTDWTLQDPGGEPLKARFTGGVMVGSTGRLLSALKGQVRSPGVLSVRGKLEARGGELEGSLRADLSWENATLTQVRLAGPSGDRVDLDEILLDFRPRVMLQEGGQFLEALDKVSVRGSTVALTRLEDGQFAAFRSVSEWLQHRKRRRPLAAPHAPVSATIDRVLYTDLAVPQTAQVEALNVRAQVDPARLWEAIESGATASAGQLSMDLAARWGGLEALAELSTDLTRTATLTSLASSHAGAPLIHARTATLEYSLGEFATEGLSGLKVIDLEAPVADITFGAHSLPTFIPAARPPKSGTRSRFIPRLLVQEGNVDLTFQAVRSAGRPLAVSLRRTSGLVDFGALSRRDWARIGRLTGAISGEFGALKASAGVRAEAGSPVQLRTVQLACRSRETLRAGTVRVDLDWPRLSRDAAAAVRLVSAQDVSARIIRDSNGKLALANCLPGRSGGTKPKASSFAPRVRVSRGDLTFVDHGRPKGVRAAGVRGLSADIRLAPFLKLLKGQPASGAGTAAGSLWAVGSGARAQGKARINFDGSLAVSDLAATLDHHPDHLHVARGFVEYDLPRLLGPEPLAGLRRVALKRAKAHVVREEDGQIRLVRLLAGPRRPAATTGRKVKPSRKPEDWLDIAPKVALSSVDALYTDLSAVDAPVTVRLSGAHGAADPRTRTGGIRAGLRVESAGLAMAARIDTDFSATATLTDLTLQERREGGADELLTVAHASARYSLSGLLRGAGAQAVDVVALDDFSARLMREAGGRLRLERLFAGLGPERESAPPAEERAAFSLPRVRFTGGRVRYTDLSLPNGPADILGTELSGSVDAGKIATVLRGDPAVGLGRLRGRLEVTTPELSAALALNADLDRRVAVSDLEADRIASGERVRIATVPRGALSYRLAALTGDRPLEGLLAIAAEDFAVHLTREAAGELFVVRAVRDLIGREGSEPDAPPEPPGEPPRFLASVSLSNGEVSYADYSRPDLGGPLRADLRVDRANLSEGTADALLAGTYEGSEGWLAGRVSATWPGARAQATIQSSPGHSELVDVEVAASEGGPWLRAASASADLALTHLLAGDLERTVQALTHVSVAGLDADLSRDAEGDLDIVALLRPLLPEPSEGESAEDEPDLLRLLTARVVAGRATVRFRDASLSPEGPVSVLARLDAADLDMGRLLGALRGEPGADAGSIAGHLAVNLPRGGLQADLRSDDVASELAVSALQADLPDAVGAPAEEDRSFRASIPEGSLQYSLWELVGDKPLEGLLAVTAEDFRVHLTRDGSGEFSVVRSARELLGMESEAETPQEPARFLASVLLNRGEVSYVDHSRPGLEGPLRAEVSLEAADLPRGSVDELLAGTYEGGQGRIVARASATWPGAWAKASMDASPRLTSLTDLEITTSEAGPRLKATSVSADLALSRLLAGDFEGTVKDLERVSVEGLDARLARNRERQLDLAEVIRPLLGEKPEKADEPSADLLSQLRAQVSAERATVQFTDLSLSPEGPVTATVRVEAADLDSARVLACLRGEERPDAGSLRGSLTMALPGGSLSGALDSADVATEMELASVSVQLAGADAAPVSVERARMDYSLAGLFGDERDVLGAFRGVVLDDPTVTLDRNEDRTFPLVELFRGLSREDEEGTAEDALEAQRFVARVRVTGGSLTFTDRSLAAGPGLVTARSVSGEVDAGALWAARAGRAHGPVGRLQADVTSVLPEESVAASVDWDLSGRLSLSRAQIQQAGSPLPLLSVGEGAITYSADEALAEDAYLPAAVQGVELTQAWLALTRGADGDLERPLTWDAYVRGPSEEADPAPHTEAPLAGLRARVRLSDVSGRYDDLAVAAEPVLVAASGLTGEIDLGRLADLLDDLPAASPGRLDGTMTVSCADAEAAGRFSADLGGRLTLENATLRAAHGERRLLDSERIVAQFDPRAIWGHSNIAAGLEELVAETTRADVLLGQDGRWELARLLRPAETAGEEKAGVSAEDFTGLLQLTDTSIHYRNLDAAPGAADLRELSAEGVAASIDLGDLWEARRTQVARDIGSLRGQFSGAYRDALFTAALDSDLDGFARVGEASLMLTEGGAPRTAVSLSRAEIEGALSSVIAGASPVGALGEVSVSGLRADVRRDAQGQVDVLRALGVTLPDPSASGSEDAAPLAGIVRLQDGEIRYQDAALELDEPLVLEALEVQGNVDLSVLRRLLEGEKVASAGSLTATLRARSGEYALSGRANTDITRRVRVEKLQTASPSEQDQRLSADEMRVEYSLEGLFREGARSLQIDRIFADTADLRVVRNVDGTWRLPRITADEAPSDQQPVEVTLGVAAFADSKVEFIDHSVRGNPPLSVRGTALNGAVDVAALRAMREDGRSRHAGSLGGRFAASVAGLSAQFALQGDISEGLQIADLALSQDGAADADRLTASVVNVYHDLGPVLAGAPYLAHLSYVGVHDPAGRIVRETDGELRLVRLAREGLWERAEATETQENGESAGFRGRIAASNAQIEYDDLSLLEDGPVRVSLSETQADVDLTDPKRPSGSVSAAVTMSTPTEQVEGRLDGQLEEQLVVSGLTVRETGSDRTLTADRIALEADLGELFDGAEQRLAAVRRVDLIGVRGYLHRGEDGAFISPGFLSRRFGRPGSEAGSGALSGPFSAWVSVQDVDLSLLDESLGTEETGPLNLRIQALAGSLLAEGQLGGEEPRVEPRGSLMGAVTATTRQATLTADVETDLVKNLWVHDLRSVDLQGERLGWVREAQIGYDLDAVLDRRPILESLRAMQLDGARIAVATTPTGDLLAAGIPVSKMRPRSAGTEAVEGTIDLQGEATTGADGVISGHLTAGGGSPLSDLTARFSYDPQDRWIDADYSLGEAAMPLLGRLVISPDDGEVLAGRITGSGFAYGRISDQPDELAWSLVGGMEDARVRLSTLGEEPLSVSGPFEATSEGVRLMGSRADWAGVSATVEGTVFDYADPCVCARVEARATAAEDLLELLRDRAPEQLTHLRLHDPVALSADVTGPLKNANAEVHLRAEGTAVAGVAGLGDVQLRGVDLTASVVGWDDPSIRGDLAAGALSVVRPDDDSEGVVSALQVADVGALRVQMVSANSELGGLSLNVASALVRGIEVSDIQGAARLVEDGVELTGAQGCALGGEVTAAGLLALAEGQDSQLSLRGSLQDVQLAMLGATPDWPDGLDVQGDLSGVFGVRIKGDDLLYAADLQAVQPSVEGRQFDSARALVSGDRKAMRLAMLEGRRGDGRVWAQGDLAARQGEGAQMAPGSLDLRVAGSDLDLSLLPVKSSQGELLGSLFLSGRVTGEFSDPDFHLSAAVFDPSLGTTKLDAVVVEARREGRSASIDHLTFSAGQAVGALSDVRLEDVALTSDDPARPAPEGLITGGLLQLAAPTADAATAIGSDLSTSGWLHANGSLSGPLRRPNVNAVLGADRLQVGEYFVDDVRLPVMLSGDTARVAEGQLRAHGAELTVLGRMSDVYGRRRWELVASLPGLALEDLPPVRRLGLDTTGLASVPQLALWGAKSAPPTGGATFRLSNLRVGGEELEPVTGWLSFGNGLVHASATKIRKASSDVSRAGDPPPVHASASATYELGDSFLDAALLIGGGKLGDATESLSPQAIRALPDIGDILQLISPLVAIGESARAEAVGSETVAEAGASAAEPEEGLHASDALARLGLRSSGRVAGELHLVGPLADLSCRARLSVWEAEIDQKPLPRWMRGSFSAGLASRHVYDIEAEAVDGGQFCRVTGDLELPAPDAGEWEEYVDQSAIDLTIDGADIELPMWRHWMPTNVPIGGSATFTLVAEGRTLSPAIHGSLNVDKPSVSGARFDQLKLPNITIQEGAITISRAKLTRTEEKAAGATGKTESGITMAGSIPWTWRRPWIPRDGNVDFRADLDDMKLAYVPVVMDEIAREKAPADRRNEPTFWAGIEAEGSVSAGVRISGPWSAPELTGQMQVTGGALRRAGWDDPLTDVSAKVRFTRENGRNLGVVESAGARWTGVQATVRDAWAYLDHLGYDDLIRNEYHASIDVVSDAGFSVAGVPVSSVSGGCSFQTQPQPQGAGGQTTPSHVFALKDMVAVMGEGRVQLGGGSTIRSFAVDELDRNDYDFTLSANRAGIRRGKQLRGILDGQLRVREVPVDSGGEAEQGVLPVRVEGGLTLSRADVSLALPKTTGAGKPIYGLSHRLPSPILDVTIDTAEAVRLRGVGMTIPVAPSRVAHLTGTLHEPSLRGSVSAREEGLQVPAGGIRVTSANIEYEFGPQRGAMKQDRTPLELRGNVFAEARQLITDADIPGWGSGEIEVLVTVRGNLPDDIRVETRSEPPLSQQQILALIGSAQLEGLGMVGAGDMDQLLTEQALGLLARGFKARIFAPLEGELIRMLGLSEFDVSFGFDQAVEVRLGKYLLKGLLVSYEHSFGTDGGEQYQAGVSYRLNNNLRVAYTTNEQSDSRLKLSYEVDY